MEYGQGILCTQYSTPKSNARIDQIFKESEEVYLVYSVVGTKAF
jgi:hypothetical protein